MKSTTASIIFALLSMLMFSACNGGEEQPADVNKVFKYAGATQCEDDGTSVEDMQRELSDAGIDVECAQRAGDGYAYPACCGCASGQINVYQISPEDIPAAQELGFERVSTLPDYQDAPCS